MLSTRRMEHGTPHLANFDLGALMGAQEGFQKKDDAAVAMFIKTLGDAGSARCVRKLSAIVHATDDQLRQAESDPAILEALEEEAANRPYAESFQDAVGFFIEWGASFKQGPSSSDPAKSKAKARKGPQGSPSAGS